MSLTYTTYTNQLANLMAALSSDPNFQTFLPGAIDYAEQRIYRELNLMAEDVTDSTMQVSSGNRFLNLPTDVGTYVVVDQANLITPAATAPSAGTRVPLVRTSRDFIDWSYPSEVSSLCGPPEYYALQSNSVISLGPAPDGAYFVEIVGTQRPTPLSSANSSTILTTYVPDLFMAASMVFASGYMRDFGQQADNPQMGAAWENQYQLLMKSAVVEQFRARAESEGWTAKQPDTLARRV